MKRVQRYRLRVEPALDKDPAQVEAAHRMMQAAFQILQAKVALLGGRCLAFYDDSGGVSRRLEPLGEKPFTGPQVDLFAED
jgi:hypothetical protein